jgi:hypothetical protein
MAKNALGVGAVEKVFWFFFSKKNILHFTLLAPTDPHNTAP